jgi:hypothetical protein
VEFGRAQTKIPHFAVGDACLDGSSGGWRPEWTWSRGAKGMVSSEGKKLVVEAEAGKRKAEAYAAEAKDRMEEYRVECDERVAKEKKFTAAAVGEQRRAEAKAAKLKAEMDALSTGNTKDPALSARGRLLAKALTEGGPRPKRFADAKK